MKMTMMRFFKMIYLQLNRSEKKTMKKLKMNCSIGKNVKCTFQLKKEPMMKICKISIRFKNSYIRGKSNKIYEKFEINEIIDMIQERERDFKEYIILRPFYLKAVNTLR
jgi:hypothetical protein